MLSPYFCIPCMKKKTSCSQSKLDFSFQGETTIVDEYRMIISHSQVKVNCHLYRLYLSYPSIKPIKYPYPIKSSFFFRSCRWFFGISPIISPNIPWKKNTSPRNTSPKSISFKYIPSIPIIMYIYIYIHGQSLVVHEKISLLLVIFLCSIYSKKLKDFPLPIQLVAYYYIPIWKKKLTIPKHQKEHRSKSHVRSTFVDDFPSISPIISPNIVQKKTKSISFK